MRILNNVLLATVIAGSLSLTAFAEGTEVYLNNQALNTAPIENEAGEYLVPLREICEKSGFTVNWIGESETIELIKGAQYITCSPNYDGYTFAKAAPVKLGSEPVLIEGTTYVPMNFVSEIMGGSVYFDGEDVIAYDSENVGKRVSLVGKEEGGILVSSFNEGEIFLNITDETVITDEKGNALTKDEIIEGVELIIEHDEAMTRSLPPQTNAKKIVVTNTLAKVVFEGKIAEIKADEDRNYVVIDTAEDVQFNIDANTQIIDTNGAFLTIDGLETGSAVKVNGSPAMTMSIPAQIYAHDVLVVVE